MTPRQVVLLLDRHREAKVHREMVGAQTTSAVINYSQFRPEEPREPKAFMPSLKISKQEQRKVSLDPTIHMNEAEKEIYEDYMMRVLASSIEQKALNVQ